MSSVCFVTSSEHSITSNILQYTPLALFHDTPLVLLQGTPLVLLYDTPLVFLYDTPLVFLYGTPLVLLYDTPLVFLYDSLPLLGKLYRLFIKSIEQALFLSPWEFNFSFSR